MILYHVGVAADKESILRRGLRLEYAQALPARIWAVRLEKLEWARLHVVHRHGCRPAETLAWPFYAAPSAWSFHWPWLFWSDCNVAPECLQEPITYEELPNVS